MTVAELSRAARRPWWSYAIPPSWLLNEGGGHREPRDRRERDTDLEDTWTYRRRLEDQPPPSPKVQVPFGVIVTITIYLVGQLVGGVWWAATLQSNLQHEIVDRAKEEERLWQSIQTYRLEVQQLRVEIARASGPKAGSNRRNLEEEE